MTTHVCLGANTHRLLEAGGHLWFYLNWALGLRAVGCDITWLEEVDVNRPVEDLCGEIHKLQDRLAPFGFDSRVALCTADGDLRPGVQIPGCHHLEDVAQADLLLNLGGKIGPCAVDRFRRSALIDIDPGIMQVWIHESKKPIARHDIYFSIGETVGKPDSPIPNCGVDWHYTPAAVYLPQWRPSPAGPDSPYTTVTSWWGWWEVFEGQTFNNEKRTTFLEYLDLPARTPVRLELALALWEEHQHEDVRLLTDHGWNVRHAFDIGSTPEQYRDYLAGSRGEFSCAKPSCMRLENAWISDRSLCYMAMGKPAIVQYTGPSQFLPDAEGLFRFRNLQQAVEAFTAVEKDYQRQGRQARALVEEYFDATTVVKNVLQRALP